MITPVKRKGRKTPRKARYIKMSGTNFEIPILFKIKSPSNLIVKGFADKENSSCYYCADKLAHQA